MTITTMRWEKPSQKQFEVVSLVVAEVALLKLRNALYLLEFLRARLVGKADENKKAVKRKDPKSSHLKKAIVYLFDTLLP